MTSVVAVRVPPTSCRVPIVVALFCVIKCTACHGHHGLVLLLLLAIILRIASHADHFRLLLLLLCPRYFLHDRIHVHF